MESTKQERAWQKKEDLFTTYDVNPEGYCVNFKGKTAQEIWKTIKAQIDPTLLEPMEYDMHSDVTYDPGSRRVITYMVRGGSEGFYLHIDSVSKEGKLTNLALVKGLGKRQDMVALTIAIDEIIDRLS